MGRLSELDAVTLDANGTLVELDRPVERLGAALREHGVERSRSAIVRAMEAEFAYYRAHMVEAHDASALARLQRGCARVFAQSVGIDADFTDAFVRALVFHPLPGVPETLERLRACGLALAVVSNWDCSLPDWLRKLGLHVDVIVTCAGAGVAKPDPAIFAAALDAIEVAPERALHIGDSPEDERGAHAAGLRFASAPLAGAVAAWT